MLIELSSHSTCAARNWIGNRLESSENFETQTSQTRLQARDWYLELDSSSRETALPRRHLPCNTVWKADNQCVILK